MVECSACEGHCATAAGELGYFEAEGTSGYVGDDV